MSALPTRQDLRQLLADTGVTLPESKPVLRQDVVHWTALVLIHFTVLLGIGDMLFRLCSNTH
ncbi:hypothetical protein [Spirosoma oryzicola]|uniref:hypothetical protein n=1 Tax=Spirosoma oryzicola TaxID=2898794 RepID=UPI001E619C03|nr:hypothetical protein [Spirosoma oryzicola]UHG94319.1 hypothetical protein LQ777_26660 [Spirosoma oryzicola]